MAYTYVTPNAQVYVLKDIPLQPDYEHTLLFEKGYQELIYEAQTRQAETFIGTGSPYIQKVFSNQMYKRVSRNSIKVSCNYDEVYMCNYMMFRNNVGELNYSHKWYYAFITNIKYISEGATEIEYRIDVMQTWMFDYQLLQSFVEREHSATDEIGDNIISEPTEVGEYIVGATDCFYVFHGTDPNDNRAINAHYSLVVAAPWKAVCTGGPGIVSDVDYQSKFSNFYGNTYSGLYYNIFDLNWVGAIDPNDSNHLGTIALQAVIGNTALSAQQHLQEIVAIYIVPTQICKNPTFDPVPGDVGQVDTSLYKNINWQYYKNGSLVTPRNKKLYTYPFNFLRITSSDGNFADYHYEFFVPQGTGGNLDPTEIPFIIQGVVGCPPQVQLIPCRYKQRISELDNTWVPNYSESLYLQNFPLCSWVTDTFKAWLAQNATKLVVGAIGSFQSDMSRFKMGNLATQYSKNVVGAAIGENTATQAAIDAGKTILNSLAEIHAASLMPDDSHGVSSGSIGASNRELGFRWYNMRVRDEYAIILDDFFDMYGYATKQCKVPNRNVRTTWCYTKTVGCAVKPTSYGGLPASAEEEIKTIYDNGITFWKDILKIGDYSYSNRPVSESNQQGGGA